MKMMKMMVKVEARVKSRVRMKMKMKMGMEMNVFLSKFFLPWAFRMLTWSAVRAVGEKRSFLRHLWYILCRL